MIYNPSDFTWGYEVEWGDIGREVDVSKFGKWEHAETDILNLKGNYALRATDPLGIDPPVGGEINMYPTKTPLQQVTQIDSLRLLFESKEYYPTASLVNHGHLHVYVPGLKDDVEGLKRLVRYIKRNQAMTVEACYGFRKHDDMKNYKNATSYLKLDGGRLMPDWMCDNIINLATDFDHFIKLHAAGKDGVSMGRPFRYAINTYCMKHTGTIEFRCFRSTVSSVEIADQFYFVQNFIECALNDGPDVDEILSDYNYKFPPFYWDAKEYQAWIDTKYDKSRGTKVREYIEVK